MMWRYYVLLTDLTPAQIEEMKKAVASGTKHPLEAKKTLARRIVADFHNAETAAQAQRDFEAQFQKASLPSDLPTVSLDGMNPIKLPQLLVKLGLCVSNSEAQRKIREGAVHLTFPHVDPPLWEKKDDPTWELNPGECQSQEFVIRVGRRMAKANLHP
jgi:tyrosyl-tRNA synthetase